MPTSSSVATSTFEAATAATTKELLKNEIMIHATSLVTLSLFILLNSLFSFNIINLSFIRITQCFISIGYFLEFFFCCIWIIFVFIWMILNCHFFKLFLYFFIGCVFLNSKKLIIIFTGFLRFLLLSLSSSTTTKSSMMTSTKASASTEASTTHIESKLCLYFEKRIGFLTQFRSMVYVFEKTN